MKQTRKELLNNIRSRNQEIDAATLNGLLKDEKNVILLDIREPQEIESGQIPGSKHLSRSFLELQIETLCPDRKQRIVLYCESGDRSLLAADSLQQMGYQKVTSLRGGLEQWKQEGFKISRKPQLSKEDRRRYRRHLSIPEVGEEGQTRLLNARVLVVGAGGLGCPAALYLAAAGIGTLGLVDADTVDETNLQRQILHTTDRIGILKTESAKQALQALNPGIQIQTVCERLTAKNALDLFAPYDIVVDGTDNFASRYLINDAAIQTGKPVVHGSVHRFEGQVTLLHPPQGPCYRCLYPQAPPPEDAPSCAEAGVLGVLPGVVGVLQAVETVKFVLEKGDLLTGRLLCYNALKASFLELKVTPDPECKGCSKNAPRLQLTDQAFICSDVGATSL